MTESLKIFVSQDTGPEPRVSARDTTAGVDDAPRTPSRSIGEIVSACHQTTIDEALQELQLPGLTRETLDDVLTYCAERRCEAVAATCRGCKRRTEAQGWETLDDFVSAHGSITVKDGSFGLQGQGEQNLEVASLEALTTSWSGHEYWFWARRVLRKLRHGVRRADVRGEPVAPSGETPAVILVGPQLADNIGMAARAMGNFGLDTLRLVNPRDGWPNERARIAASGANYIIDDTQSHDTLAPALSDLNWVCATTARQRDMRKPVMTPAQAAKEMARRIAAGQRCGMMFGRESSGLESDEVAVADALVMIPVNSRFASLNLAQAVLILGYAWMLERPVEDQNLGRVTTYEKPVSPGLQLKHDNPATKAELLGFFEHLEGALDDQGFFRPSHRRAVLVRNLRAMFTRMGATDQEVRTLRGIVATLLRAKRKS
ncbi:MAG: RNA methyltransferase [Hyphomicrobiaceae bacterium]